MNCLKEILLIFAFLNGLGETTVVGHLLIFGGKESTGDRMVSGTMESFYPEHPVANRIEATLSPVRTSFAMGVIGDTVLLAGGHSGHGDYWNAYQRSTTLYYPVNKTFVSAPNLSIKRAGPEGVVLDGIFIVCGGHINGGSYYRSCEALVGDVWEPRASMLEKRGGGFGMVVLNGKIYAMGGDQAYDSTPTSSVESYNLANNSWSAVASLPVPLAALGAAVAQGNIYVSGGQTHHNATCIDGDLSCKGRNANCYKYSDLTDTWSQVNPMNRVRYGHVMVEMGGLVFALGGHTSCCNNAEVYDPATGNWTMLATTLKEERKNSEAVVVYTDVIAHSDFIMIGRNVRGLGGISVQSERRTTSCASVCDKIKECSFFSYKESSEQCYMHDSIAPAQRENGFVMFAKVFTST